MKLAHCGAVVTPDAVLKKGSRDEKANAPGVFESEHRHHKQPL